MRRIVVIGPESTGKSTLCEDLARYFKSTYLPEYARIYLENNGSKYTYEDVLKMIKGQLESEEHFVLQNRESSFLLLDTNYLVYKVWIKEKYGKEEFIIEKLLKEDNYDFYFLCDIDVPWEFDELREHPNYEDRNRILNEYKIILTRNKLPFIILQGNRQDRLERAKIIINNLMG
tara:strand:+ start:1873 stop:2397 length:525 start_codon:yes stop_codon:yes gene_type:complete